MRYLVCVVVRAFCVLAVLVIYGGGAKRLSQAMSHYREDTASATRQMGQRGAFQAHHWSERGAVGPTLSAKS